MPVFLFSRSFTCSSTFICFANWKSVNIAAQEEKGFHIEIGKMTYQFGDSIIFAGKFSHWSDNVCGSHTSSRHNQSMRRALLLRRLLQLFWVLRELFNKIRKLFQCPRFLPCCGILDWSRFTDLLVSRLGTTRPRRSYRRESDQIFQQDSNRYRICWVFVQDGRREVGCPSAGTRCWDQAQHQGIHRSESFPFSSWLSLQLGRHQPGAFSKASTFWMKWRRIMRAGSFMYGSPRSKKRLRKFFLFQKKVKFFTVSNF